MGARGKMWGPYVDKRKEGRPRLRWANSLQLVQVYSSQVEQKSGERERTKKKTYVKYNREAGSVLIQTTSNCTI